MNVRKKRRANIGNSLEHFLMVAILRLRTAAVPKNKNIVQSAPNYCIEKLKTPQVLQTPYVPHGIDDKKKKKITKIMAFARNLDSFGDMVKNDVFIVITKNSLLPK